MNNVDAVTTLLQRDANKDAQDSRDQTPLFLAAREGSFEAVKVLLDHHSNRDITDHMDRLPRTIAHDRMHHDIVGLLDNYYPNSPVARDAGGYQATELSSSSSSSIPPAAAAFLGNGKTKPKRPTKKTKAHHAAEQDSLLPAPNGCKEQQMVSLGPAKKYKAKAVVHSQAQGAVGAPPLPGSLDRALSIGTISPLGLQDYVEQIAFDFPPSYETACNEHDLVMSEPNISTISGSMQLSTTARNQYKSDSLASDPLYQNISHPLMPFDMSQMAPVEDWMANIHQNLQQLPPTAASGFSHGTDGNQMSAVVGNPYALNRGGAAVSNIRPNFGHFAAPSGCASNFPGRGGGQLVQGASGGIHGIVPPRRKKPLPLSPTHIQALQQHHAQRNCLHPSSQQSSPSQHQSMAAYNNQPYGPDHSQVWSGQQPMMLPNHHHHHHQQHLAPPPPPPPPPMPPVRHYLHHYPTPPSQHGSETVPHLLQGYLPEHFLTPSPDSPGQWSSSSPISAQSDWSEGISSPAQPTIHALSTTAAAAAAACGNRTTVPKMEGL